MHLSDVGSESLFRSETPSAQVFGLDGVPQGSAFLVVKRGPNAGSRFLLDQATTTAGRHPNSDIFLDDITVSRRHAQFRCVSGEFKVVDVGSLNGTYVNREAVNSAVLANGDEVQIGKFRLVFLTGPTTGDTNQMWGKRPDMIVRGQLPFNAEPPAPVLADDAITALDAFYSRNHGPFPDIAPEQWRLTVDGAVDTPLTLTYDQLTSEFTAHSVLATLVCAGNRRTELLKVHPIPGKDPWAHGAISTAEWRGARLADVLHAAGVHPAEGLHVAFAAPDVAQEAVPVQSYGSSIPLPKALSAEVLLAWQMNSQPLPRAHGGPVRVVVPGYIGARSVKWVTAITVQPVPSQNYFQALDYRLLPPDTDPDTAAPGEGISLSSLPLNCDILVPSDDAEISAGPLTIRGWALAGDGRSVARVDVSLDDGRTWRQANLEPPISRWAWRQWSITVETQPGPLSVTARAWDDTGVTHPESPASLWNPRGYGNNAWAHITASAI